MASRSTVRALILAAGFGTRLAPVTDTLPKPLLPVRGRPVVVSTLERLRRAGVEAVALNLHHRGEAVREALGDEYRGMGLVYSPEPEILGTFGALAPLADFFAGADAVLVVNGDSLCRWPFRRLLRHHRRSQAAATMLFSTRAEPERYGGGVLVDRRGRGGRVLGFDPPSERDDEAEGLGAEGIEGSAERLVFAGAQVLSPGLVSRAPHRIAGLVEELYRPLLVDGERLGAVATRTPWHDLGTPGRYLDAVTGGWLPRPPWVDPEAVVAPGAKVRRSAVEAGAVVEADARLTGTVVLGAAVVGRGARLERCLVAPGTRVPEGARIEGRLVARATAATTRPAGSSTVGDLLYAPLEPTG